MEYSIKLNNGIQLSGLDNINENLSTHYTIYKITNNINRKHYIGQHMTDNIYDRYIGSSNLVANAISKYNLSSFTKTILHDFDNFDDMNNKEAELVQLSNCYPYDNLSYNLQEGGLNGKKNEISNKKLSYSWKNRLSSMSQSDKNKLTYGTRIWWNNLTNDELQKWKYKVSEGGKRRFKNKEARKQMSIKLQKVWSNTELRKKLSMKLSGDNNPMKGEKLSAHMTEEKYAIWKKHVIEANRKNLQSIKFREKRSILTRGQNNPMYGKNIKDFMTKDAYNERLRKMKLSMKNRKWINDGKQQKFVKIEEVQNYLNLGWKLGQKK